MKREPETECSKKKVVDSHYEEQWEGYSKEDVEKRVVNLSPVLDAILSELDIPSESRVLDLGCGPAILPLRAGELISRELRICGVDISGRALQLGRTIAISRGLDTRIELVKGDCEALPFQDNSFDGVVSNATMNLLPDKNAGFREMARVTRKEGTMVVGDCTARDGAGCSKVDDEDLWSACIAGAPTRQEFERLARDSGLNVTCLKEMTGVVADLVNSHLWKWPEFIDHEMDYYILVMKKI